MRDSRATWGGRPYPRVLHVIASLAVGGTERQLVEFINRSSNPGRHLVALFDEPGSLAREIPNPPIMLGRIGRRPRDYLANLLTIWNLRERIGRLRIDLLHAHLGISEVMGAMAAPRRVPLVASRRGRNVGFEDQWWLKLLEGLSHRRVELMLCNSRYLAEHTRSHDLWVPPIRVIRNGIDLERFKPSPMPPPEPPTVVQVANLKWYKRQEDLLAAVRLVVRELPSAQVLLVGDGPDRERLEKLTAEWGLADNVTFTGQVVDTRPYVKLAHVATLSSLHEGFPNALLESMAMGRPVVATRVGGIPELVRDGQDGFLVGQDPEAFARALMELLSQSQLRERMATQARERAETFGWDRVVAETEAVYLELLDRHMSRGRKSGCAGSLGS